MIDRGTFVLYDRGAASPGRICPTCRPQAGSAGVWMAESLGGLNYIDVRTVQVLDALIARCVAAAPVGYLQVWLYVQVEAGQVRQVGISPVIGESVRFADGGRNRHGR